MQERKHDNLQHPDTVRIVMLYAVFAGLWILLSDEIIRHLVADPLTLNLLQSFKGLLFVGFTSALLYLLLNRRFWPQDATNPQLLHRGLVLWPAWLLYLLSIVLPLGTLLVRNDMAQLFDERPLMILFMLPILLSAIIGGLGPGICATLTSLVALSIDVLPPLDSLYVERTEDRVELAMLAGNGLIVSMLSMMLHHARFHTERARQEAEENLERQQQAAALLHAIADGSTDAIYAKDLEGRYLLFNRAASEYVGKPAIEVIGRDDHALFPQPEAEELQHNDRQVTAERRTITAEESLTTSHGLTHFLVTKAPLYDSEQHPIGIFGISRDITYLKQAESELRQQRDFAETLIDTAQAIILMLDPQGRIVRFNDFMQKLSGWKLTEVAGRDWFSIFVPASEQEETRRVFLSAINDTNTQNNIGTIVTRDGRKLAIEWSDRTLKDASGNVIGLLAVGMDITERQHAEKEIHRLAFYDSLTGLPNRALLLDRLGMMLPIVQRQQRHDALLLVNIDRFKAINDTSGQAVGDALLKALGERLSGLLREGDVLARISGDEFAILLPDLSKQSHAAAHQSMHVAEKIHYALREAFNIDGEHYTLTTCIGIALFPMHKSDDTPLDILRRANSALHKAKEKGGAQSALFEQSMDEDTKQRFQLERELRDGIAKGQLRVYLQPQVDAQGNQVGAEALVRWQHPQRGLVPPALFIPLAEESDLIVEIGTWMLQQVCCLLSHPQLLGRPYRIAINISPRQFRQPDFVDLVRHALATCGAEPTRLTLEVTEGVVIDNVNEVIARMNELAIMGIHFSVDDFGTGYSSLAYLKRLPIHELKIDKTFVQDAPSDPNDAALIESILAVAGHMHLKVVAEGVETQEQADFLNGRGTIIHQGYLYGQPQPAQELLAQLPPLKRH